MQILQTFDLYPLVSFLQMGYDWNTFEKKRRLISTMMELHWSPLADLEDLIYESNCPTASER